MCLWRSELSAFILVLMYPLKQKLMSILSLQLIYRYIWTLLFSYQRKLNAWFHLQNSAIPTKLPEPIRASEAVAKKSQTKARLVKERQKLWLSPEDLEANSAFSCQTDGPRSNHGNLYCSPPATQSWSNSTPANIRHSPYSASAHSTQETKCGCWSASGYR